jgi:hypothetical protein
MGVVTEADERLHSAQEHIKEALKDISEIYIDRCWGHDDFNSEYKQKIKETFQTLIELRDKFE